MILDNGTSDIYFNEVMFNAIVKILKEKCKVGSSCVVWTTCAVNEVNSPFVYSFCHSYIHPQ